MKAQVKIPDSAAEQPAAPEAAPPGSPVIDARAAANEEWHDRKHEPPENPLWLITIGMAAFFIVAALVIMLS
jgi:hypothetical protein